MTDEADDLDPLEHLLDEFTQEVRAGRSPDIESWAQRHPAHADGIRELFPAILAVEEMKTDSDSARSARPAFRFVDRLGDYQIIGEIGRGGMGVVYEAEQESLGRRVAVKVLPPMRDPRRVERFEREARTAGRLHHTNIVPIFGVGDHEDWHYYVMPLIRGVGLDAALHALRGTPDVDTTRRTTTELTPAEAARALQTGRFQPPKRGSGSADTPRPDTPDTEAPRYPAATPPPPVIRDVAQDAAQYWRSVARIGHQVADALGYAHAQGVLHRDIKPGNLLIDAHGVVWVTDFGLAKAVDTVGMTMSGDLVGTLQYMAPEQLHGRYDARTDVYGLGLVLYELLALRPAFSDPERGGLLKKIEQGRPAPPSTLRKGIPRDLETIVLHAIQPDPAHRYQTAAELADDLQRFLDDRPVAARRANRLEHAWRWCRRNRLVAGLAAIAIVSLLGALVTGWIGYVNQRRASALANANLDDALRAFEQIFDAAAGPDEFDFVVDETSGEAALEWVQPTAPSPEMAKLLGTLLTFYDRFAETNAKDLRQDIAKAQRRVGDLNVRLGKGPEAIAAYERALALYRQLDGGSRKYSPTIAEIHNGMGRAWHEAGDRDKAHAASQAAFDELADLDSRPARFERARTHELIASTYRRDRRGPRPGAGPGPGDRPGPPPERGEGGRRPGMEQGRRGPFEGFRAPPEMVSNLRAAWELDQALATEAPENAVFQLGASRTTRLLADALEFGAAQAERTDVIATDIARQEALIDRFPDNRSHRLQLAQTYLSSLPRIALRSSPAAGDQSAKRIDAAEALAKELLRADPESPGCARILAIVATERARLRILDAEHLDVEELRRAADLLGQGPMDSPLDAMRAFLARISLVQTLSARGDDTRAARELEIGLDLVERSERENRDDPSRTGFVRFGRGRGDFGMMMFRRPEILQVLGIDAEKPELERVLREFEDRHRRRPR